MVRMRSGTSLSRSQSPPTVKRSVGHIIWTEKESLWLDWRLGGLPTFPSRVLPELLTLGEGKAGAVGKVAAVWLLSL